MQSALYDPEFGYYRRADRVRWGRKGDYRTSPERSSLFGITFAAYFVKLHQELGQPPAWTILEIGAGDGSFASSVLSALETSAPEVFQATRYVIVEASRHAEMLARKQLAPFADRVSFSSFADVKIDVGVVFSNELLDAVPVHRVAMSGGVLSEFYVDVSTAGEFEWKLGPLSTVRLNEYFADLGVVLGEGQIAEANLEIEDWLRELTGRIQRGFVITVDYGAETSELYPSTRDHPRYLGTLRSFQRHQVIDDLLAAPGEQDLTATINWSLVKSFGQKYGLEVVEFERQDRFLLAAGLLDQLERETRRTDSEADKLSLNTAALEMILPTGMAASFQVLVQKRL